MRRHTFNLLLIALSAYDFIFLLSELIVTSLPELGVTAVFDFLGSCGLSCGVVFAKVVYPMSPVAYSGSVYMTMAITVERYF